MPTLLNSLYVSPITLQIQVYNRRAVHTTYRQKCFLYNWFRMSLQFWLQQMRTACDESQRLFTWTRYRTTPGSLQTKLQGKIWRRSRDIRHVMCLSFITALSHIATALWSNFYKTERQSFFYTEAGAWQTNTVVSGWGQVLQILAVSIQWSFLT